MANLLTRWDPLGEISELRHRLDELFEGPNGAHDWIPRIDVVQEEGRIVMRADVPGVKPEDIEIEVEDDVLTISGEHEEREEEKDKRFVRCERRYGSFARSISLPKGVSAEDVGASCEDGVLEVAIPLPEQAERKAVRITPKAGESD